MGIIKNITIKKEINGLFEKSNEIYNQIHDSLRPSLNVFFHYTYFVVERINRAQEVSILDLEHSFANLNVKIVDFFKNRDSIINLFENYPKLKIKYTKNLQELNKNSKNVNSRIFALESNIRNLEDYNTFYELNFILKKLTKTKNILSSCSNNPTKLVNTGISANTSQF